MKMNHGDTKTQRKKLKLRASVSQWLVSAFANMQ